MGQLSPEEIETLAKKWLDGSITPSEALVFDQWYEQVVDPTLVLQTGDKDAEAFRARLLERIKATVAAGGERVDDEEPGFEHQAAGEERADGEEPGFEQQAAGEGGKLIPMKRNSWPARLAAIACIILLVAGIWQWARVQENTASGVAGPLSQNILTTERGKQAQLLLPDGTRVWLNAASSLTYPPAFNSSERTVTLTGEGYFEVVHNDKMPFRVKVGSREIEDLGTHFNVHAYASEPGFKTTLLQGSVRIGPVVLQPGEQASVDDKGNVKVLKGADLEQAVAWKNGMFQFDHADLKVVMGELSRWYGVDVRFEGNAASRQFGGKISRLSSLQEALQVLELSKVHFRIEKKIIVVLP